MALKENRAEVVWTGDLMNGMGRLRVDSGAFPELPVTFRARTEGEESRTNPEELIAAAHAICYSMVLANMLAKNGTPADALNVAAVAALDRIESGLKITSIDLSVRGEAHGIDAADFRRMAEEAERNCPVSNALRGSVEIRVRTEAASVRA